MNLYNIFAGLTQFEQDFIALKHSVDISFYSVYLVVMLLMLTIIINHIRFKKLFMKTLIPFFVLFAIHPAWLMILFNVSSIEREVSSYVFAGLGIVWFLISLFAVKPPAKPVQSKEESEISD